MKRIAAIIAGLATAFFAAAQDYGELFEAESTSALRSAVSFFCSDSLGGRQAGSKGEAMAADYVEASFLDAGLELLNSGDDRSFGIRQESGDTLRSRNVAAVIPGYDRKLKDRYIVLGARLEDGNASGLAVLLSLARTLSTNRVLLKRSVVLAAFGSASLTNAGSWYFLNRSFSEAGNIDAMINLDRLGEGASGFYAYTSSNADLNSAIRALEATLQPLQPGILTKEPFPSEHRSFYSRQIPSVLFTSSKGPDYDFRKDDPSSFQYDYMAREQEYLYNFTVSLAGGPAPVMYPDKEQDKSLNTKTVAYYDCDRRPSFFGSADPASFLRRWVYVYLKYPDYARENGIQGRVLVDFTIDENGHVGDVSVRHGVHPSLDAEAVRVISASPDWKPGILDGRKVKASMSLYVDFRLERKKRR